MKAKAAFSLAAPLLLSSCASAFAPAARARSSCSYVMVGRGVAATNGENICPEIPTAPTRAPTNELAVLASGWFWHPQRDFRRLPGVADVVVGYTGGQKANPTYANIMDATEAFLVEFDPAVVSYEEILDEWAAQHAPSHPASSRQYRSAIFYRDDAQRDAATKKLVAMSRGGERKVCVDLEPASAFYRGEEYHQDFLDKQTGARAPAF